MPSEGLEKHFIFAKKKAQIFANREQVTLTYRSTEKEDPRLNLQHEKKPKSTLNSIANNPRILFPNLKFRICELTEAVPRSRTTQASIAVRPLTTVMLVGVSGSMKGLKVVSEVEVTVGEASRTLYGGRFLRYSGKSFVGFEPGIWENRKNNYFLKRKWGDAGLCFLLYVF